MSTGRKVFHCAVDETALSTNISEIKKWTANGAIDLVVPLYTLERLHALKRAGSQVAINAREAVRFLDRVTSGKDHIAANRVVLQGPMEQYERWEEAEKFFLPEFEEEPEVIDEVLTNGKPAIEPSADDTLAKNEPDDLSQMLLSKLNFKKDPEAVSITSVGTPSGPGSRTSSRSSRTSPECAQHESRNGTKNDKIKSKSSSHQRTISGSVIPTAPPALRPLLSALLWRLHTGPDAENSAKTCILITNDRATQVWAQKFGIGVKNILQLRTAIQYEEREYKNRCKYVEKTQTQPAEPKTLLSYEEESDEDELVFVPRGRGKGTPRGASRGGGPRKAAPKTAPPLVEPVSTVEVPTKPIDPDSFSRSLGGATKPNTVDLSNQQGAAGATGAPRGNAGGSRRSSNGRRGGSSRGARGNGRGRGKLWVP
ncbi:uncharacterized protein N7479_010036 [Penicillium vulpinum]|uniref:PIN domain-containing protein n=1 Tax=Penicillium vulpinum TaxID=29845 RepID=A0A1V6RDX7_9EURO|nr:uncharacterized protein N7479_010036 [Penicillium vulpinum]KAJ5951623.1 hypothetical protein N7479_010036 [Penicillium vulpinum]OQE00015.1 hypothetical protein PENVUL_c060G03941 [Penicillium vulpinum]